MHYQGDLLGQGPVWGYVEGGMGRISFAIAEAAATSVRCWPPGCRWPRSSRARGPARGRRPHPAKVVVSNADPKRALEMLVPDAVPDPFRRLEAGRSGRRS